MPLDIYLADWTRLVDMLVCSCLKLTNMDAVIHVFYTSLFQIHILVALKVGYFTLISYQVILTEVNLLVHSS